MQKVFCDICNAECNPSTIVILGDNKYATAEVFIHHNGRTLDICDACRNKLIRYAFNDMREGEE